MLQLEIFHFDVVLLFSFTVLLFHTNDKNSLNLIKGLNMFYESSKLLFWNFRYKHILGCGSFYNMSWTKTLKLTKLILASCGFLVAITAYSYEIKHTYMASPFQKQHRSLLTFSLCHLKKASIGTFLDSFMSYDLLIWVKCDY